VLSLRARYHVCMRRYYYALGRKVALTPDARRVAVNASKAATQGLDNVVQLAHRSTTKLPGGLALVSRADLRSEDVVRMTQSGVVQSVYRHGPSTTIPMPEVRVELDPGQRKAALEAARSSRVEAEITENSDERLVLRPISGSGDDALDLANFIFEKARPASSSVRMVQVVARPDVRRR